MTQQTTKKMIIIDGNALVHRAFHALPPLAAPDGRIVNAVYGFSSVLIKIIKDLKPDYLVAAFDLAGPTFRHDEYAEYKAQRKKAPDELYAQIPLIKDVLKAFGASLYEMEGFEADDLIGTIATQGKRNPPAGGLQVIIATGDLDTLQLVDEDKVVVFTMKKGISDTVIYNEKMVHERYGLGPEQLNDYKGLKGDPSDNITGVPGIGEKTAGFLITVFGSIENMYTKLENSDTKKLAKKYELSEKLIQKLLENKDKAIFSKRLSTIITDLPVKFDIKQAQWQKHADIKQVETLFKGFGFSSLLKRLPEIGLVDSDNVGTQTSLPIAPAKPLQNADKNAFLITSGGKGLTNKLLEDDTQLLVGHDLKDSLKPLLAKETDVRCKLFDTKIAAYLLYPDLKDYDFTKIYYQEFKEEAEDPNQSEGYLWQLKGHLESKLKDAQLLPLFEDIEMPLIPVLAEMELAGIKVDTKMLAKLQKSGDEALAKLEKQIYKLAGTDFNINSPQQLAEILYNRLAIKGRVRRTGGGALSTAAPELEKLIDEHPIIELIMQYRELQKLKTTYIEPFPTLVDANDGRVHTTYNQSGAGTGRLSSNNPNLQNIPIKTELGREFRKAFVAEKGYELVSFDYSQLELRIVAHIAKDKKMTEVFRQGGDIHTRTAVEIFGVKPEEATKDMRRVAKVLNFGIIYGMGSLGFARAAGVDRNRAKDFIAKYFEEFDGVAKYMENTKQQAHDQGYVETIFGRKRPTPEIYSTMPQLQAAAERAAINHPIQGTAADLVKLAMIKVHDYLGDKQKSARMLLQVHDEIVCEIKKEKVPEICKRIKEIMESVHKLDVPLIADVKVGPNWQDQTKILNI